MVRTPTIKKKSLISRPVNFYNYCSFLAIYFICLEIVTLHVHVSVFHHSVPPSITAGSDGPTDTKVVLSKSLILECEAEGHPPPSLTWLKDGSPIAVRESLRVLEQGRKLEILSALPSDAGRYVCVATSVAGEREIKYDVSVLGICTHIYIFVVIY